MCATCAQDIIQVWADPGINMPESKLFRASKRLLNMQPDKVLPPYTNALTLGN